MAKTMRKQSRNECLKTVRYRYLRHTGKAAKTRLPGAFCEVTGRGRKCADKLLGGRSGPGHGGEFLHHHHRHFTARGRPVEMTRSRAHHKND